MTAPRPSRVPLVAAFAASVLLHVAAAMLLGGSSPSDAGFEDGLQPPTMDADATPGIAESDAVTVSWIGFADPTPHTAPEAETEQAQVSPDAGESTREAEAAARRAVVQAAEAASEAASQASDSIREQVSPLLEQGTVLAEALRDQAIVAARRREAAEAAARAAEARAARESTEGSRDAMPDERDAAATATEPEMVYTAGQPLAR
ncbi:MAG: hypothetical protein AAFY46_16740, partial [Planctomycetota bacterium]